MRETSLDALYYPREALVDVVYRWRPDRQFWAELRPSDERRLRSIFAGEQDMVTLPVADRILTQIGLHLWMLPEPKRTAKMPDGSISIVG